MRVICRSVIAVMVAAGLAGCITNYKAHSNLPPDQVAVLKPSRQFYDGQMYQTSLHAYAEVKDSQIGEFNRFVAGLLGDPMRLELPAGDYIIQVKCRVNLAHAKLFVPARMQGGGEYEASCGPADGQINTAFGSIRRIE